MKVRHTKGATMDVPERTAARLVAGSSWHYVDPPEPPTEEPLAHAGGGYPCEPAEAPEPATKPAPTIPEIRSWARENGVANVPAKGKLPRHAVEAYVEAHKEN